MDLGYGLDRPLLWSRMTCLMFLLSLKIYFPQRDVLVEVHLSTDSWEVDIKENQIWRTEYIKKIKQVSLANGYLKDLK